MLPDSTSSPASLSIGSDSPVSSDSSISRPSADAHDRRRPRPGRRRAARAGRRARRRRPRSRATAPSRTTRAVGADSTARRSSVRFARHSCTMPISALVTSTKPNSASCAAPNTRISTNIVPRIALKRVKSSRGRSRRAIGSCARRRGCTRPRCSRSATSAARQPVGAGDEARELPAPPPCPPRTKTVVADSVRLPGVTGPLPARDQRTRQLLVEASRKINHASTATVTSPTSTITTHRTLCLRSARPGTGESHASRRGRSRASWVDHQRTTSTPMAWPPPGSRGLPGTGHSETDRFRTSPETPDSGSSTASLLDLVGDCSDHRVGLSPSRTAGEMYRVSLLARRYEDGIL